LHTYEKAKTELKLRRQKAPKTSSLFFCPDSFQTYLNYRGHWQAIQVKYMSIRLVVSGYQIVTYL